MQAVLLDCGQGWEGDWRPLMQQAIIGIVRIGCARHIADMQNRSLSLVRKILIGASLAAAMADTTFLLGWYFRQKIEKPLFLKVVDRPSYTGPLKHGEDFWGRDRMSKVSVEAEERQSSYIVESVLECRADKFEFFTATEDVTWIIIPQDIGIERVSECLASNRDIQVFLATEEFSSFHLLD